MALRALMIVHSSLPGQWHYKITWYHNLISKFSPEKVGTQNSLCSFSRGELGGDCLGATTSTKAVSFGEETGTAQVFNLWFRKHPTPPPLVLEEATGQTVIGWNLGPILLPLVEHPDPVPFRLCPSYSSACEMGCIRSDRPRSPTDHYLVWIWTLVSQVVYSLKVLINFFETPDKFLWKWCRLQS